MVREHGQAVAADLLEAAAACCAEIQVRCGRPLLPGRVEAAPAPTQALLVERVMPVQIPETA